MGLLGKQQQGASHPEKNYCLITGSSNPDPDAEAGGKSTWPSCSRMWLSERHVPQKPKMFHCVHAYLTINGYTETEVAWVGKAPVPYETIHSSIHPFCWCLFAAAAFPPVSSQPGNECGWGEGDIPHGCPIVQRGGGRKEKGKQLSLLGPLHHHYLLTHRFAYLKEQSQKSKTGEPVPASADSLCEFVQFLQILCI